MHGPGIDDPIVAYEGTGTTSRSFLSSDERGSVISTTDSSGTVLGINRYDEYGNPQSTNIGAFGYTGQTWLPSIKLWYYKARAYGPEPGRLWQTDPIGYESGPNRYAYVLNDPVNLIDSSGLSGADFAGYAGGCIRCNAGSVIGEQNGEIVGVVTGTRGEMNDFQKAMYASQAMYMIGRPYNFLDAATIGRLSEKQAQNEANKAERNQQCTVSKRDSANTGAIAGSAVAIPEFVKLGSRLLGGVAIRSIIAGAGTEAAGGALAVFGGPVVLGIIAVGVGVYAYDRYSGGQITRLVNRGLDKVNMKIGEGCK